MTTTITLPTLDAILASAADAGASDVHLTGGLPAVCRIDGDLAEVQGFGQELPGDWVEGALAGIMTAEQRKQFAVAGEVDLAYSAAGIGRFRVNVFRQMGDVAAALRLIPDEVRSLKALGVPEIARDLALKPRGLVLVTGPTGSGKSATLTAMVDIINRERAAHIITIEDPIEFVHSSRHSLVHQREVGSDTASFGEALRRVLRQDPDVILLGELRDAESIAVALSAAETGHLVLATLHTQGAAKSINRIVDVFPAERRDQVRAQLGDTLQGVLSQTLLPGLRGGRVLATEVMVQTPAVANLIREGQIQQLYSALQSGSEFGMHTLDQSLRELVKDGRIEKSLAQQFAVDQRSLEKTRAVPADLDDEVWATRGGVARPANWGV